MIFLEYAVNKYFIVFHDKLPDNVIRNLKSKSISHGTIEHQIISDEYIIEG